MKSKVLWSEQIKDLEDNNLRIRSIAYSPDGEELLVTANEELRVYGARSGVLIQSLRAHRDTLTCVVYARDGKRFATGSMDKQVIIWTNKWEGILKYSHNDVITCLEYNPMTNVLASCSTVDFGLWSSEQKAVSKFKVPNAINDCSWSLDGQLLALAYVSGHISIRTRNGEEKFKIERPSTSPIWVISFHLNIRTGEETLVLFDYDQKMNAFDKTGKSLWQERSVQFDAQFIDFIQNNEFLIAGGSNRMVNVYTLEGVYIGNLENKQNSWIRAAKSHPFLNQLAIGTYSGQLTVLEIEQSFLKGRHRDRFVYRENMTDVVVHHLITNEKVRIKCHSLVCQLALYHQRLAIKLSERIIIYELPQDSNDTDMRYKLKTKINMPHDCDHLLIYAQHLLLIEDKKILCFRFDGILEREWMLEEKVTMVLPVGGITGKESCLIGVYNGSIMQLFVHSQFPVTLLKLKNTPIIADLSVKRTYASFIDTLNNCYVYELATNQLIYQELNATAVAWNQHFDEMLCFSNNNTLTIKCDLMTTFNQQIQGNVIAFVGSKLFTLNGRRVQWMEVTQSVPMYQYLQKKQFDKAYSAACQGVTEHDWSRLGHAALQAFELPVATRAFQRLNELAFMSLLDRFRRSNQQPVMISESARISLLGDVSAMQGQLSQAARLYVQAGHLDKAVSMYSDLRLFEAAQELLQSSGAQADQKSLAAYRAKWQSQLTNQMDNQPRMVAEQAIQLEQWNRALPIVKQLAAIDLMLVISRKIDVKQNPNAARQCAQMLLQHKQNLAACELLQKLGDHMQLAKIYAADQNWIQAYHLLCQHPELKQIVLLPYAEYLAENGHFVKAQQAFYLAKKMDQALLVLQRLIRNALAEQKYSDAGYYSWILSTQCLEIASEQGTSGQQNKYLNQFNKTQTNSSLYYAFGPIFWSLQQPFTAMSTDALFNRAKFILHESNTSNQHLPVGISRAVLLFSLARHSVQLGAFRFSRLLHEQLKCLQLPAKLKDAAEQAHLTVRCRPFNDAEELLPLCYRCSTTNPLFNVKGNRCVNCDEPFVFSFISFEMLPLVKMRIQKDISDLEAADLLLQSSFEFEHHKHKDLSKNQSQSNKSTLNQNDMESINVLKIDDNSDENSLNFYHSNSKQELNEAMQMLGNQEYDRNMLIKMQPSEVIILRWSKPKRYEFYRNLVPEVNVVNCENCNKLFLSEEFESYIIQHRCCPFCRKTLFSINK